MANYDWSSIEARRGAGETWPGIAEDYDVTPGTIRKAYSRYQGNAQDASVDDDTRRETDSVLLTRDDIARITTLDDLLTFFEVDREMWEVSTFRVNKWEQHSVKKGVTPLYQVRANLKRNMARKVEIARSALEQARRDMDEHSPPYDEEIPRLSTGSGLNLGPVLYEIAPMDPHLGMLAWGREVGEPFDLDIGERDYKQAVKTLVGMAGPYPVERILYIVGNDMLHVDTIMDKVATTTSGTPQDFDSRLPKLFTAARRAAVYGIDLARTVAPVDVMVVSGNHDEHSMYRLGEVLNAWYRNDDRVNVLYGPKKRKSYQYGENGFLFTHGEEFKRRREPLPLIMADEYPQLWADTTYREVHCGHYHATKELNYMSPSKDLDETRGVRVRALPGLTAIDNWHYERGYRHTRAATSLVWRKDGGLAGLHEYHPGEGQPE